MTLDEFFEQLSKFGKGKFVLNTGLQLIRKKSENLSEQVCPIEYVYARLKHQSLRDVRYQADYASIQLGLSYKDGSDIMWAADAKNVKPKLRKRMLKALGLKE